MGKILPTTPHNSYNNFGRLMGPYTLKNQEQQKHTRVGYRRGVLI